MDASMSTASFGSQHHQHHMPSPRHSLLRSMPTSVQVTIYVVDAHRGDLWTMASPEQQHSTPAASTPGTTPKHRIPMGCGLVGRVATSTRLSERVLGGADDFAAMPGHGSGHVSYVSATPPSASRSSRASSPGSLGSHHHQHQQQQHRYGGGHVHQPRAQHADGSPRSSTIFTPNPRVLELGYATSDPRYDATADLAVASVAARLHQRPRHRGLYHRASSPLARTGDPDQLHVTTAAFEGVGSEAGAGAGAGAGAFHAASSPRDWGPGAPSVRCLTVAGFFGRGPAAAAAGEEGGPTVIVQVARPGTQPFSAVQVAHVEALSQLIAAAVQVKKRPGLQFNGARTTHTHTNQSPRMCM